MRIVAVVASAVLMACAPFPAWAAHTCPAPGQLAVGIPPLGGVPGQWAGTPPADAGGMVFADATVFIHASGARALDCFYLSDEGRQSLRYGLGLGIVIQGHAGWRKAAELNFGTFHECRAALQDCTFDNIE